jgi:phenylpropionate dioxygenase-like ring-hydroxylating dioxygenase large terminal subunit
MFLGHQTDVKSNLKKPLAQYQNKKILVNQEGNFKLANNICPHQGSLIISKMQNDLVCQYHGWGWDTYGNPISSGSTKICNNAKIGMKDIVTESSLLFTEPINLATVNDVDLSHMRLIEERIDTVKTDYKNILDVFLDVDHIPVVHAGVYDSIGISGNTDVSWEYFDWGNIQLVKKTADYSTEYSKTLLGNEKLAAFWITVYPGTMIEWQPGAMFITVCVPQDKTTDVCIFKYRDIRYNDQNWKINSNMWETAWQQDKTQSEAIVRQSDFHPHLEDSKIHFRDWLNDNSNR